jgi:asparagine synthase (glutamine-hydrolysing)
MCGIAGMAGGGREFEAKPVLERMIASLYHRGPDDSGMLVEPGIAFGMRRLAIIDVAHGRQPITTADGMFSIIFNGEIYNYRDIMARLEREGVVFQTRSDTETILHAYRLWGSDCLDYLRGMFTIAIWDRRDSSLFIARDRLGVKPLYWGVFGGQLIFASELKALLEHPAVGREVNADSVSGYLALRYSPGPDSLIRGIEKFPAAHWMRWQGGNITLCRYWRPDIAPPWQGSAAEAQESFDSLFDEATRLRMISERPVGAFLSGGLDSTAIVASLAKQFPQSLKTFSVGFGWEGDELSAAAQTAQLLGCEHQEIVCRAEDTALLPKIVWHLDEPVGDGIVLPMYLLSQLASRSVTVVQSGEGADEILGGYFMHRLLRWAGLYSRYVPDLLQDHLIIPMVSRIPSGWLNLLFDYPGSLGETGKQRLLELLRLLREASTAEQYHFAISLFSPAELNNLYTDQFRSQLSHDLGGDGRERAWLDLNAILGLQFEHWLPDDILCKQDKMTMAHSLEGRVPFMDHKLVELVTSMPSQYKLTTRRNKVLLRNYLAHSRASHTAARRKVPFYIPIDQYLSAPPLKTMVDELLSESSVRRRGLFRWDAVRALRASGEGSGFLFGKQVFSLAMLELWYRIFVDQERGWL